MQHTGSGTAALIQEVLAVADDLISALHLASDELEDNERNRTAAQAWLNSIKALRDIVRLAIATARVVGQTARRAATIGSTQSGDVA